MNLYSSATFALWRVLVSVRLTIAVLVTGIALSVAGTLIAQQGMTTVPLEKLYAPATLKWLNVFGLTDVFHSPLFIFVILTLAMNLLACSFERLPRIWKQTFHIPAPPVGDPLLKNWTPAEAKKGKYILHRPGSGTFASVREAKMATLLFFERHFGKYEVLRDRDDQFQIMLEKGKYSRLGVYVTHISLLLLMAGGVTGAIWGFDGGMNIEEGSRQSWMQHNKGSYGGLPLFRENGVSVKGFLNLGFEVECESFALETYDGSRPKSFRSKLNFYENDVRVASAEIAVNHPFVYKGMTFYQASYSELGVGAVDLKVFRRAKGTSRATSSEEKPGAQDAARDTRGKDDVEMVQKVHPGDLYRIDGDAAFSVTAIEPNLMNLGPAAKLKFFPTRATAKPREFWIFQNLPGFDFAHRKADAIHFVLDSLRPKFATGIAVAKDPGAPLMGLGALILILALFTALYTHHARHWVAYTPKDGFVVVGWSNKLLFFEPRFEKFFSEFRKELKL